MRAFRIHMGSVIPSNTIDNWPIKALLPDILKPTAADFHLLYSRSTLGCLPFSNHEPILKKFSSLFTWVGTLHVYNNHMEGVVLYFGVDLGRCQRRSIRVWAESEGDWILVTVSEVTSLALCVSCFNIIISLSTSF